MRRLFLWAVVLLAWPAGAAEHRFEFSVGDENQLPAGFRSAVAGEGEPGEWKVVLDEVPSAIDPLTSKAPSVARRAVLAQVSRDRTDEHFPLLIYEGASYDDFTFTTRFRTVAGSVEQMAGIAFRIQDERNFYVLRASSLGGTFRFYKVVNGERGPVIGPEVAIPQGVWHEVSVECKGNHIRCFLNGQELIPMLTDSSFTAGKIGFWTKSDSVTHFADARVTYTPREILAQTLVRDALREYPKLRGLDIFAVRPGADGPTLIASVDGAAVGRSAEEPERNVIRRGVSYFNRDKDFVVVILPLRDRNGDPIAAVRVELNSFAGQTEDNAIVRAMPVLKLMQRRVLRLDDLLN